MKYIFLITLFLIGNSARASQVLEEVRIYKKLKIDPKLQEVFENLSMQEKGQQLFEHHYITVFRNYNNQDRVIQGLELVFNEQNISKRFKEDEWRTPLHELQYDSDAFNFGLFKLGGIFEENIEFDHLATMVACLSSNPLCLQKPFISSTDSNEDFFENQQNIFNLDGFRIKGKVFILESERPLPDCRFMLPQERVEYWESALSPTLWPDAFQRGNGWSIEMLKEQIITVLGSFKHIQQKKNTRIPSNIIKHYLLPEICEPLLVAIKERFDQVYTTLVNNVESLSKLKFMDIEQEEFFKNFKPWYSQKAQEILKKKFGIICAAIRTYNSNKD